LNGRIERVAGGAMDLFFIAVAAVFFAASVALCATFERIRKRR
jgi:hypothetical protein